TLALIPSAPTMAVKGKGKQIATDDPGSSSGSKRRGAGRGGAGPSSSSAKRRRGRSGVLQFVDDAAGVDDEYEEDEEEEEEEEAEELQDDLDDGTEPRIGFPEAANPTRVGWVALISWFGWGLGFGAMHSPLCFDVLVRSMC
uniref:Uncharacterized protein n=1 Tax=Aegilops tauschii subsp. strangulata TaxID=200361 RepID=A0A452ZHI1_AEGTS